MAADSGDVAELVDLEHELVLHPRVVRVALVVEVDRLARMSEEDRVTVTLRAA